MPVTNLTIARSGFALPLDAVTTTIGIIGIRGSGKTHTASVVAEEMLAARLQVIVLDPLDVWHGLRSSADGKGAGYPITVLGGEHSDVPLEASSGNIVADFAVKHGASLVLSLRDFSKTDQRRFVGEFCERLYRLKGQSVCKSPVHIVIDEADEVAPQKIYKGAERCFGAVDTLVRRGRSSGIGVTLISQRPAAVNKDVLTQIELLIAHRVISPQDRKAISLWIEAHPVGDTADKMAKSLASLSKGECWVWSPSWLQTFERITVRQRRTFDSSATPKVGSRIVAPSGRADVDLDALKTAMAETIKRAEEDDPRTLRKRIASLERELHEQKAVLTRLPAEDHSQCRANENALTESNAELRRVLLHAQERLDRIRVAADFKNELPAEVKPTIPLTPTKRLIPPPPNAREIMPPRRVPAESNGNGSGLSKCERAILTVLAQHNRAMDVRRISIISGYRQSGSFSGALASLRAGGMIEGPGSSIEITDKGITRLGEYETLPTGVESVEYWANRLGECASKILRQLLKDTRHIYSIEKLAEKTGYKVSGSFSGALAELRALGLITERGPISLSDEVLS